MKEKDKLHTGELYFPDDEELFSEQLTYLEKTLMLGRLEGWRRSK